MASAAACYEPVVSHPAANSALVLCPYALGAFLYAAGAVCYKICALRALAAARRSHERAHPACEWARVGVQGAACMRPPVALSLHAMLLPPAPQPKVLISGGG